jgi:hypothetical protein
VTTNRPTPSPEKTNWAAVSAVAAVAGVLIALMAYAIPRSASTSNPLPTPTNAESAPYTTPQQDPADTPAATSSGAAPSGPIVSQPAGEPAGCQQGEAAITRYDNRTRPYNEQVAAGEALQDIGLAEAAANGSSSGAIYGDLQALNEDFIYLQDYPPGSPQSDAALARAKTDSQRLSKDCGTY